MPRVSVIKKHLVVPSRAIAPSAPKNWLHSDTMFNEICKTFNRLKECKEQNEYEVIWRNLICSITDFRRTFKNEAYQQNPSLKKWYDQKYYKVIQKDALLEYIYQCRNSIEYNDNSGLEWKKTFTLTGDNTMIKDGDFCFDVKSVLIHNDGEYSIKYTHNNPINQKRDVVVDFYRNLLNEAKKYRIVY